MTAESVARTLEAAEGWLRARSSPDAVIDMREAGVVDAETGAATRAVRRILDRQGPDGSWDGRLLETAEALLTLREIRDAAGLREQDPGIGRGLEWVRNRRGLPGAWTDGCSPERHARGLCHHFMGGFFSPAPPEDPQDATVLRCGVTAISDAEGRFLSSTAALRCLRAWGEATSTDSRLHLRGLAGVVRAWGGGAPDELGNTSLLAAIQALLRSDDAEDRDAAAFGLRLVAGHQRGDGSWVGTDPFQALEVFLEAEAVDVCPDRCHRALWHGARLLISTQREDGSWGGEAADRRALIACRTLRRVDPPAQQAPGP